ncbi:BolA family protein [Nitrincola iocasae]|jgi:acid stress-induced BolA-like protein IbaG/YrbA|uniref:BolA family transcriptional regulator n=1 Tax=Nitrincola iocasae TaxID=2614693 RepID=A0A5J6LFR5_9GAMM|nr:BolA family protein [Nitrincola iocasae]QEW07470.1 BolA family transcriptional regulator [Nitrincola iocasae]
MQAEDVKQVIESQLAASQVMTAGEGCNFEITVISEQFTGLSPVKKQQLVYACLNKQIASGDIHAVTIKTYTPEQWAALN